MARHSWNCTGGNLEYTFQSELHEWQERQPIKRDLGDVLTCGKWGAGRNLMKGLGCRNTQEFKAVAFSLCMDEF